MFSDPVLLKNGNLLVPMTAESEDGDIGDGMVEIDNTHPDFVEWMKFLPNKIVVTKGGPGSGNKGHKGRPGFVGGSMPGGGGSGSGTSTTEDNPMSPKGTEGFTPGNGNVDLAPSGTTGWSVVRGDVAVNEPRIQEIYNITTQGIGNVHTGYDAWTTLTPSERGMIKNELITNLSLSTNIPYDQINSTVESWSKTSNDTDMRALLMQEAVSKEFGIPLSPWQQEKIDSIRRISEINKRAFEEIPVQEQAWADKVKAGEITWTEAYYHIQTLVDEKKLLFEERNKYPGELERAGYLYSKGSQDPSIPTERERMNLVREMYNYTQRRLEMSGVGPDDELQLYRGVNLSRKLSSTTVGNKVKYKGNCAESWSISYGAADSFKYGKFKHQYTLGMKVPRRNIFCLSTTGYGCIIEGEVVVFGVPDSHAMILHHRYE